MNWYQDAQIVPDRRTPILNLWNRVKKTVEAYRTHITGIDNQYDTTVVTGIIQSLLFRKAEFKILFVEGFSLRYGSGATFTHLCWKMDARPCIGVVFSHRSSALPNRPMVWTSWSLSRPCNHPHRPIALGPVTVKYPYNWISTTPRRSKLSRSPLLARDSSSMISPCPVTTYSWAWATDTCVSAPL